MPVGVRDLLLVIRAKDQASRVIQDVGVAFDSLSGEAEKAAKSSIATGAAMVGVGVAFTAAGALGLKTLYGWTKAAIDYNNTAALTLTQIDQTGVTLQQVGNIGLEVASKVAAPLEQMQPALYDIFSSMDVNLPQAQELLTQFSKAAVAGQVDVQTAGRATIAIMNAYKVPIQNASDVMDFQFQLVKKGVGTYDEFATAIGKAIPSARRAGQDLSNLGGVLAFLTRNGLSASMASTSAARAFDNLANPKVQANMQKYGISVLDSAGNIKQMSEVAGELGQKLSGLTDADKAKALNAIFTGAGNNIQARRFWDLAIRNFGDLNNLTQDMVDRSGALSQAYDIMFGQPAAQAQLLKNNWDALKISIGQALVPFFSQLVSVLSKVVGWFNQLNQSTKDTIAKVAAFVSLGLTVAGVLLIIAGAAKILKGALDLAGGAMNVFLTVISDPMLLLVVAVLAAIAGAAYLIWKNWDTVGPIWQKLWADIKKDAEVVWVWLQNTWAEWWPKIKQQFLTTWNAILDWVHKNWPAIKAKFLETWNAVVTWIKENWPKIRDWFMNTFDAIRDWWEKNWPQIRDTAITIWEDIKIAWAKLVQAFQDGYNWFVDNLLPGFIRAWDAIDKNVGPIIQDIRDIVNALWGDLQTVVAWIQNNILPVVLPIVEQLASYWWIVADNFTRAWQAITTVFSGVITVIRGIWDAFAGLFTGDWSRFWDGIKTIASGIWTIIQGFWEGFLNVIKTQLDTAMGALSIAWDNGWQLIKAVAELIWVGIQLAWDAFWTLIKNIFSTGMSTIKDLWDSGWHGLAGVVDSVVSTIKGIIQGLIDKIHEAIAAVQSLPGIVGNAVSKIPVIGGPAAAAGSFLGLPGFAAGGGVQAGQVLSRNEFGREIFVPAVRGTMLTAGQVASLVKLKSGGGTQVVIAPGALSVTISGTPAPEDTRKVVQQEFEKLLTGLKRL